MRSISPLAGDVRSHAPSFGSARRVLRGRSGVRAGYINRLKGHLEFLGQFQPR